MSMYAPRLLVAGSPVTPVPYGLLSAATMVDDPDPHWQNGVEFDNIPCDAASVVSGSCGTVGPTKEPTSTGDASSCADPFTVYSWIDCSTVGGYDTAQERVTQALLNGEARAAEKWFWENQLATGAVTGCATEAETLTADAIPIVAAIGLLEQELGTRYGGLGVIHVPRGFLAYMSSLSLLYVDGDTLRTLGGTAVAAGAGYDGTGPGNTTPTLGTTWFYATGAITGRRSAPVLTSTNQSSVNKSNNSQVLIAERTYVYGWDCGHLAALATVSNPN